LIEAMIRMMNTPKGFTGPVNIGNPEEFTILELAKKIIEMTSSKSRITFLPLPHDDPRQRRPTIELAKKTLNWSPKTPLDSGLQQTINYFKSIVC
jgi:UDP-glucuronate decarboxylase